MKGFGISFVYLSCCEFSFSIFFSFSLRTMIIKKRCDSCQWIYLFFDFYRDISYAMCTHKNNDLEFWGEPFLLTLRNWHLWFGPIITRLGSLSSFEYCYILLLQLMGQFVKRYNHVQGGHIHILLPFAAQAESLNTRLSCIDFSILCFIKC